MANFILVGVRQGNNMKFIHFNKGIWQIFIMKNKNLKQIPKSEYNLSKEIETNVLFIYVQFTTYF